MMPEGMTAQYTMNGKIPLWYLYFDDRIIADYQIINNEMQVYEAKFKEIKKGQFDYYFGEGAALLDAVKKYDLSGKTVIVWGLAGCNCEALAVYYGAKKVYVIDYNKPKCAHPRIEVLNHEELEKAQIKADFSFSYSSFEHDGLGRYGDPLAPDGDLKAMSDVYKYLQPDGTFFLGVPLGPDCLVWNANRIYGKLRLPLLLKDWTITDVFDVYNINTTDYPFDMKLGDHRQNVLVLKKNTYKPSISEADDRKYKTRRVDILNRLNAVLRA